MTIVTIEQRPPAIVPDSLTLEQEAFCQHYVLNDECRSIGYLAYEQAYGFDLDTLSHENEKDATQKDILDSSPYKRAYMVCAVNASRLLKQAKIQRRITALLNAQLRDEIVDGELSKVILQDRKLESKVGAIREYNKLRQRVTEKLDITSGGLPLTPGTVLPEVIAEADRLLKERKLNQKAQ